MRPNYWFCINAGGQATRMGPWAPRLKPFLPIGPLDPEDEEGVARRGPCAVERILRNYQAWIAANPQMRQQVQIVLATGNNPRAIYDWMETIGLTELAEGVLIVPDAVETKGPMALVHQAPDGVHLVLHNGDDLIARRALHNFLDFVFSEQRRSEAFKQSTVLMTTKVQQRGAFGEIVTTDYGFRVAEKPVLKEASVGCGVLFLASVDVDYAKRLQSSNSSTVLTALEAAYAHGKRQQFAHPVTFEIPSHYWATIGNPEEYLNACNSEAWLADENWQEWLQTLGRA